MRKTWKKILTVATAAVMAAGTLTALPACSSFTALTGDYTTGDVVSNGGFVVEKGNYYYFINGVEDYSADNTYGDVVKGSLMRILKTDLKNGDNTAETVIPSLIVAADYTSGIYIYGDRVYYATPNNVKNTSGEIDTAYLTYKSAKLDGTDIKSYFTVSDNSTVYRYVEVDNVVYLVYEEDSAVHSYNVSDGTDTVLFSDSESYVLNSSDVTDPYVYYTMSVTVDIDNDGALDREYNQIYRVRADATEAPYEYTYSEEYLEDNDGEEPYANLGEILLDGIGAVYVDSPTQFTHDLTEGLTPESYAGYSYTLLSYNNDGIYFTRSDLATTDTTGETGWLYYVPVSSFGDYNASSRSWNSISGNASSNLEAIAQSTDYASASAIFYIDGDGHHYLYIDGSNIYRADVNKDDSGDYTKGTATTTLIARDASDGTLMRFDNTSSDTYDYVYYVLSGTTGYTINRAVTNGSEDDYKILNYSESEAYQPVAIYDIEHASGWYNFELIDGMLFYSDTQAFSDTSYNYISCVDLNNANGELMDNTEIAAMNDLYDSIMGDEGYLAELEDNDYANLADAIEYYFYMGKDNLFYVDNDDYDDDALTADGYLVYEATVFYTNIQESIDEGKKETYLYSTEEQELFQKWVEGTGDAEDFVDGNGVSYRTRSYFITRIGQMTDDDKETFQTYWEDVIQSYTADEDDSTLPTWAWVLIGVGSGVVLIGAALAIFFIVRAKKRKKAEGGEEKEELLYVDTTDDEDVDVYADMDETPAKEPTEEAAEPVDGEAAESAPEGEENGESAEGEDDKVLQFPQKDDSNGEE